LCLRLHWFGARAVSIAEIVQNDFNLDIPRYDTFETPEEVDITKVQKKIAALEARLA